ncbi:hypothetical protein quinque_007471 [Culex quinquefasciatus]
MVQDAYNLYMELWEKIDERGIKKRVARDLKACRSSSEIIAYVRSLLDQFRLLDLTDLPGDGKNDAEAIACRKRGNGLVNPRIARYVSAIRFYNKSIALAEANSAALAEAYGNRSAVCFALKEYQAALDNIRLARENPYPENLMHLVDKREQDCRQLLSEMGKQGELTAELAAKVELSHEPNPKIPQIANCLELKHEDQYGRCIVTNRDLKVGDVVIIEKPHSTVLDEELRYLHCDFCNLEAFLSLIPCKQCSIAMFCSNDCYQGALDSYHRLECPVIKDVRLLFPNVMVLAFRTLAKTITSFNNNVEELKLFTECVEQTNPSPFYYDWTTIGAKDVFATIYSMSTLQGKHTTIDLLQHAVYAIVMSELLFVKTLLGELCGSNEAHRDFIRVLALHLCHIAPVNFRTQDYMDYTPKGREQFSAKSHFTASYPIMSLMNHSCAPNVDRIDMPSSRAIVVIRPIKKGGQLFDNYGMHYCFAKRDERQSELMDVYYFECKCEACVRNYTIYRLLPTKLRGGSFASVMSPEIDEKLTRHDKRAAAAVLPACYRFLEKLDHLYPCLELSAMQLSVQRCFQMLYSLESGKEKYKDICLI